MLLKKKYEEIYENVYSSKDCDARLAPYKKVVDGLKEQILPFCFSFAERDCCFAILEYAAGQEDVVISPFLLKISHLPRARINIMFCSELYKKIHHQGVAKVALRYFVERHDPEEFPKRVHSEDIDFALDIFRYNPRLRCDAAMVAKIFTRIGAIKPSFRQALYSGDWQQRHIFLKRLETPNGVLWEKCGRISDIQHIKCGLIQLADSYDELNALVDDICRNYLLLMIEGCHFQGDTLYILAEKERQILSYVGEHLYLKTVQSTVVSKYARMQIPEEDMDPVFLRITNLEALTTFMGYYSRGFPSSFEGIFKNETVCSVSKNILTNKCYTQGDIDLLTQLIDYRKPILASFIEFVQGVFVKSSL